ncbi:MAG TPA: hypothetical protein VGA66_14690, partial [Mycobacterium sp.]
MPAGVAPTPLNYSNVVDTGVLPDFAEARWQLTKRKRLALDSLIQSGKVTPSATGGKYLDWLATVGEYALNDHSDGGQRTFERQNMEVTYVAPWAFLETTDAVSENDVDFGASKAARWDFIKERATKVVDDQIKKLNDKIINQNCDANSNAVFGVAAYTGTQRFFGLPTLFGYGTTATVYNFATSAVATTLITATASAREVIPNTTYCGISTHPTNAISGVPAAARVIGATSPVIVNHNSTDFGTGSGTTWQINCLSVVDHMITRVNKDGSMDYMPDIGMLTQAMYLQMKQAIRDAVVNQVVLENDEPRSPDMGMYKRFFMKYNGVTISYDIAAIADTFFLLNTKKAKMQYRDVNVAGVDQGPYQT